MRRSSRADGVGWIVRGPHEPVNAPAGETQWVSEHFDGEFDPGSG